MLEISLTMKATEYASANTTATDNEEEEEDKHE